jgi:hypothetical protein
VQREKEKVKARVKLLHEERSEMHRISTIMYLAIEDIYMYRELRLPRSGGLDWLPYHTTHDL